MPITATRSKVIAETSVFDNNIGQIDHNSYNKDNETNWLSWDEKELNIELVDYYKGLIQLRKKYPEFRHSEPEDFEFLDVGEQVALAYILQNKFIVALNGDSENNLEFDLPKGEWSYLIDSEKIDLNSDKTVSGKLVIKPTSGIVLIKK